MKSYIEASLDFIESEEMRDYLRKELPKFQSVAWHCAEIVAYAPAPIEQKLPVLEHIVQEADPELAFDGEPFTADAARFTRSCRDALEERYHNVDGAMFWLEAFSYSEKGSRIAEVDAFFTGFDAAVNYLKEAAKCFPEESFDEDLNYTITKCLPIDGERLAEYCTWYMNNAFDLWYFDFRSHPHKWEHRKDWEPLLEYLGNLNLPVPFQAGDIIAADCLPYAAPRRLLILDVGDNHDCCCLQALFIDEEGHLDIGAVKHNHFLSHSENSHVSVLYRVRKWTGELTAEEEPFAALSPLIQARPEFGREILDCFWKHHSRNNARTHELDFMTWQELKGELGL